MKILGINSAYHESSASIVIDGKIVAALEEERFTRIKHAKEASVSGPAELPKNSVLRLEGALCPFSLALADAVTRRAGCARQ